MQLAARFRLGAARDLARHRRRGARAARALPRGAAAVHTPAASPQVGPAGEAPPLLRALFSPRLTDAAHVLFEVRERAPGVKSSNPKPEARTFAPWEKPS